MRAYKWKLACKYAICAYFEAHASNSTFISFRLMRYQLTTVTSKHWLFFLFYCSIITPFRLPPATCFVRKALSLSALPWPNGSSMVLWQVIITPRHSELHTWISHIITWIHIMTTNLYDYYDYDYYIELWLLYDYFKLQRKFMRTVVKLKILRDHDGFKGTWYVYALGV